MVSHDSNKNRAIIDVPDGARDRDVFHDSTGRVYVVLGHIQPQNRILSYLKYIPASDGKWISDKKHYRRIFSFDIESIVKSDNIIPSKYVVDDRHFGMKLLEIPKTDVAKYFSPEIRLSEIVSEGPKDAVEERVRAIADAIHDTLGTSYDVLGVTGSVVWNAHDPRWSDVNLNIYGFENSWLLQDNYEEVTEQTKGICLRTDEGWVRRITRVSSRIPDMSNNDLVKLYDRRTEFSHDGQFITVMPVLYPEEAPIKHGSERFELLTQEPVEVSMDIETVDYGIFQPSVYEGQSEPVGIIDENTVSRILIYDGDFRGMLREGDRVAIMGSIQRVVPHDSEPFYQVMVGTKSGAGREHIRIID
ncbi:MAG: hypothetical protein RTU30_01200 [Candidatus Thorarchaeota archaeon]